MKEQGKLKVRRENNDLGGNLKKNEEILSKNLRKNRDERDKELKIKENEDELASCGIDFQTWKRNLEVLEKEVRDLKRNKTNEKRGVSERKAKEPLKVKETETKLDHKKKEKQSKNVHFVIFVFLMKIGIGRISLLTRRK